MKWATCNVGASSPEEYGDYYAWGETETKSTYDYSDYSTYKWCNGSETTITKYCTDSSFGTVDNKGVLDPEDDVAQVKWGGNWRMPTDAEMTELRENCTWTWTTQGGKDGYKVTGSNGNSIFLPAAGNRYDSSLGDAGSNGDYWSSSLYTSSPSGAWSVGFYSDVYRNGSGRYYGRSVRAVQNETPAAPPTTGTAKATINSVDTDVNWVQLWAGGPKFAEFNVGATSAPEYGGYYTWGGTYTNGEGIPWTDDHNTTNTGSRNLTGTDDTATNLWGSNWRMPTKDELEALLTNCDIEIVNVPANESLLGLKFKGKGDYSSNSIFLPAAGSTQHGFISGTPGAGLYYWSSTSESSNTACWMYVYYYKSDQSDHIYSGVSNGLDRSQGYSVRAVLAE